MFVVCSPGGCRYFVLLEHITKIVFVRGRTGAPFLIRACVDRVTFLATFCFVYLPYEVAMPSETNSAKERQRVDYTLGTTRDATRRVFIAIHRDSSTPRFLR